MADPVWPHFVISKPYLTINGVPVNVAWDEELLVPAAEPDMSDIPKCWKVTNPKTGEYVFIHDHDRIRAAERGERELGLQSCQAEIEEIPF